MKAMDGEKSVLRWGGLAGIVGGILLVTVFVIVGVFVGPDPAETEELVARFPDVRAAHIVEEVLHLGVLALWAINFLALYRALRGTSLASGLFGSALGIMGLVVLAAGALPQVGRTRSPISTTLLEQPPRNRRRSSSCGRRPRAYSMRYSSRGSSSCPQVSSPSGWLCWGLRPLARASVERAW